MFSLVKSPAGYLDELNAATEFGKLLLENALRAKIDWSASASAWDQIFSSPGWEQIFVAQTRISRDYFLDIQLDGLVAWDAVPVLKFRYAVQEATRSPNIAEWDTQRFDTALSDFFYAWRNAIAEHIPQQSVRTEELEPPEVGQLEERLKRVYRACRFAVETLSERTPIEAITKRHVWDWLREHSPRGYELPGFETFERYLRDIPSLFPKQRRGRGSCARGRSVVRVSEL